MLPHTCPAGVWGPNPGAAWAQQPPPLPRRRRHVAGSGPRAQRAGVACGPAATLSPWPPPGVFTAHLKCSIEWQRLGLTGRLWTRPCDCPQVGAPRGAWSIRSPATAAPGGCADSSWPLTRWPSFSGLLIVLGLSSSYTKPVCFFIPSPASPGLGLQPRAVGVPGRGPEGTVSQYPSERAWRGRGRRNPRAPLPRPGPGTAHRDWPCAHPPAARAEAPRTAALPLFPELTSCGPRTFERGSRDRLDQELVAGVRDTCPFLPQDSGHPCTAADPDRCLTPVSPQHFIDLFKF